MLQHDVRKQDTKKKIEMFCGTVLFKVMLYPVSRDEG